MENKVVVITGSARGLGKALADQCEKLGTHVVRSSFAGENGTEKADVTNESELEHLRDEVVKKWGKIDYWINNAGTWSSPKQFESITKNEWHGMFEINMFGAANGMRVALSQMKQQGFGVIVNIVSTAALTGRPLLSAYSASKHALKGLTDSVREELRETQIKIIGVYPGGIKTELFDGARPLDYDNFMEPAFVAEKIISNLLAPNPEESLILKRPNQPGFK